MPFGGFHDRVTLLKVEALDAVVTLEEISDRLARSGLFIEAEALAQLRALILDRLRR